MHINNVNGWKKEEKNLILNNLCKPSIELKSFEACSTFYKSTTKSTNISILFFIAMFSGFYFNEILLIIARSLVYLMLIHLVHLPPADHNELSLM